MTGPEEPLNLSPDSEWNSTSTAIVSLILPARLPALDCFAFSYTSHAS
jgi:hypothetical protein